MTRIIAGAAGGRRLTVPAGNGTRPTADRVREGLFSSLLSQRGTLAGDRVLDLYAGSGALGLEALSRGAAETWLVDREPRAVAALRHNVAAVALPGGQVLAEPVERLLAQPPDTPFDVVFADPPYALDVTPALALLVSNGWLAPGGSIVVEQATRNGELTWPDGIEGVRNRRYGETTLWYGSRTSST